jgi:cell division protein FtsI (penicillin-binding protein 3)
MRGARGNGSRWDTTVHGRIRFLSIIIPLLLCLPAARAFQFQVLQGESLSKRASRQSRTVEKIAPRRGPIIDRTGQPLAISVPVPSVYALRQEVADKKLAANKLAQVLDMSAKEIHGRLARGNGFVWVKRRVTPEVASSVRSLGLDGINIREESRRYYPNIELAGAVLGFVGADGGLEGVENAFEENLRGGYSTRVLERDARGKAIVSGDHEVDEMPTGSTVQLTLDRNIQFFTEKYLAEGCSKASARACSAIVMESDSGKVLAMANYPRFNPNDFGRYDQEAFRNRAVNLTFEPGSTFKVITVAAALQEQVFDEKDILFCENGSFQVADRVINDHMPHGWLTLRGIMKKSSNIGASKVGMELGAGVLGDYVAEFGFGARTGIEVPGEGRGIVRKSRKWTQVDLANIAFGQGLAVTPLQMAAAVNTIATGGMLMAPYMVEKITTATGEVLHQGAPRSVRQVLSAPVARKVAKMMEAVTEEGGSGTRAIMEGYRAAGKTGTAQKFIQSEGKYSSDRFIASFVGFAPVEDPRITAIIVVDEPKSNIYGGVVAAPIWARVVEKSLQQLKVRTNLPDPVQEPEVPAGTRWAAGGAQEPKDATHTPDLKGMTLREALTRLASHDVQIDIMGRGVVTVQFPEAGTPLGGEIRLTLKPRTGQG